MITAIVMLRGQVVWRSPVAQEGYLGAGGWTRPTDADVKRWALDMAEEEGALTGHTRPDASVLLRRTG